MENAHIYQKIVTFPITYDLMIALRLCALLLKLSFQTVFKVSGLTVRPAMP